MVNNKCSSDIFKFIISKYLHKLITLGQQLKFTLSKCFGLRNDSPASRNEICLILKTAHKPQN